MHYNRDQCKRPSVKRVLYPKELASRPYAVIKNDHFCWQHEKIASTPGAAYPEIACYFEYMLPPFFNP